MIRLLGIDPGFSSVGWAIVEHHPDAGVRLVSLGVMRTKKATRKQNVLAAADNFRRAQEIGRELGALMLSARVDVVCAEAMSFPRSSSVAAKMAMCWGVLAQLCETLSLPLTQASPQQIKRSVTGNAAASKDDVAAALSLRFPDTVALVASVPASLHEHAHDAVGAIVACLESDVVRAAARGCSPLQIHSEGQTKNRQKEVVHA